MPSKFTGVDIRLRAYCKTKSGPGLCREFPGLLDDIRIWFRDYKKPDGKPENKFGFSDQWQNKEYTLKVVSETHGFYNSLKSGKRENTEELSLA